MKKTPQNDHLLIVFAKNTAMGPVKTRLAESLGPVRASKIYTLISSKVRQAVLALPCAVEVHYYPDVQQKDQWDVPHVRKRKQYGADLGQRMQHAIQSGFDAGYTRVCLIGTDIPALTTDILEQAFVALDREEVVLGPADDGGYYLVGMVRPVPTLFTGIPWSTEAVFVKSVEKLAEQNIGYATVAMLTDVDTMEDLIKTGLWPPSGNL